MAILALSDNVIPDQINENAWECVATTNNSWGYKSYDDDWEKPIEILYWLVANVSKGGNLLLNVGPDGYGVIPPEAVSNLKRLVNGLRLTALLSTEQNHGILITKVILRLKWVALNTGKKPNSTLILVMMISGSQKRR